MTTRHAARNERRVLHELLVPIIAEGLRAGDDDYGSTAEDAASAIYAAGFRLVAVD